jgi:hypothetical protein
LDLKVGNGRLLAWTTANMTISVVIIADAHSRPLVIVIDLVSLFGENEQRLFEASPYSVGGKPTKTPLKLKKSRRRCGGAAFSQEI